MMEVLNNSEQTGCTFAPKIDKVSSQIEHEKSRVYHEENPRYEQLYNLSKGKKYRIDALKEAFRETNTFAPEINEYPKGTSKLLDMPFFDRLDYYPKFTYFGQ